MSEVEEIMKRVSSHKGVTGAIIIDKEGNLYTNFIYSAFPGVRHVFEIKCPSTHLGFGRVKHLTVFFSELND